MNHNFPHNYWSPNDGALLDDYRAVFVFLERVLARERALQITEEDPMQSG